MTIDTFVAIAKRLPAVFVCVLLAGIAGLAAACNTGGTLPNPVGCDDGLACTTDTMQASGKCGYTINPGFCVIGQKCWSAGQADPTNACEICAPATDTSQWSPAAKGTACDDGSVMTTGDACDGLGYCMGTTVQCTQATDCTDVPECGTAACTEGTCRVVLNKGFCLIDGTCIASGARKPDFHCLVCTPASATDAWVAEVKGTACDDGNANTINDQCDADGACAGTLVACHDDLGCDDGKDCTNDSCNLSSHTCIHELIPEKCLIDGTCRDDGALEGAVGDASCHRCVAALPDSWTMMKGGEACDDGNAATVFDKCGAGGVCAGTTEGCRNDGACDDGLDCTTDTCNLTTYACQYVVVSGNCLIDGACHEDGALHAATGNGSCHKCVASTPDVWTLLVGGEACDDGNAATISDACGIGGVCAGQVAECLDDGACNDGKACTTDTCNLATHACAHVLSEGACWIDGVCWTEGDAPTNDSCVICDVGTSQSAWKILPEPRACGTAGVCSGGACHDPWPPIQAWSLGKACELPTCDAGMTLPFDHSGNWTVTTHTTATDCNDLVQTADPRFLVGDVHTGSAHPLNIVGGCDYQAGGTTVQIGTFVSNVEVTCVVAPRPMSTTSVETSVVTFADADVATGRTTVDLYDIPEIAGQAGNHCTISMDVTLRRIPDCTTNADCNDGASCTTDTCGAGGICVHALAADTCLIDGVCVANMALKGATGNDSCYVCVGSAPSQYGWIQMGSGEPCDDGSALTVNDRCLLGGRCAGAIP